MYQQGKPYGLIIGNNAGGLFLQQLMGAKGIEFDGKNLSSSECRAVDHPACAITMVSGVTSMEQWFAAKEPIKFGGVGPAGPRLIFHAALGLPIRVIDRYKGTAEIRLATESGELAGRLFRLGVA